MQLVRATTRDGLRLDGIYEPIEAASACRGAVLCLHGAASNFYTGTMFDRLTPLFHQRGWSVLRVNTRGHDGYFAARTVLGPVRLGAAYERVSDCTLDVAAWLEWIVGRGLPQAIMVGHSLGAIKAIFSQAFEPHALVKCVLAMSPPRLSESVYRASAAAEFMPMLSTAQRLVGQGEPRTIVESTFPFPMLITAEAFLDKYGAETYNIVQFVDRARVPIGFIYGERELNDGNASFAGLPASLSERIADPVRLRLEVIGGADHFYTGCHQALGASVTRMLDWIECSVGGDCR